MKHPSADPEKSVGPRGHGDEVLPMRGGSIVLCIGLGIVELDGDRVVFTNVERARPERGPSAGLQPCLAEDFVGHLGARPNAMRDHGELGRRGGRDLPIWGEESGRIVVLTVENQSLNKNRSDFVSF